MEPLIALTAVTVGLLIAGRAGVKTFTSPVTALRFGLATMFLMTGIAHFVEMRGELIRMVPSGLPAPGALVTITGILELLGVFGLARERSAPLAAAGLTVLMVAMFPANVSAAQHDLGSSISDRLPYRTAMELVFLAATITVACHGRLTRTARRHESRPAPHHPAASVSSPGHTVLPVSSGVGGTGFD